MRITVLICLLLTIPSPVLLAGERETLDEALKAFRTGEAKECLKLLEKIPEESKLRPKADYLTGESWLLLGEAEKAGKAFRAVLKARPKAVPALTGLGKSLLAKGESAKAVKELEKAVKLDKKDVDARRTLGQALAAEGRTKAALAALRKAWKQDRKNPLTARALVEVLVEEDMAAEAKPIARAVIKARKDEPMGYFLLGLVLDREKKTDEAEKAYLTALTKDDAFIDAHKNLAILYHSVNPTYRDVERTKKSMKHYERYFELGGRDEELRKVYLQTKGFLTQMGVLPK
jgi:tetratricopeptide (TPR) repeat protein